MITVSGAEMRMERLLGAPVTAEWKPLPCWFELSSKIGETNLNWCMVMEDFDYTDDELMEKFVKPIKSVLHE